MTSSYEFNKRVARTRHVKTIYDKNIDLMYDENGNSTDLRKLINFIIAKIELGEFSQTFIGGINQEIRYARKLKNDSLKSSYDRHPGRKVRRKRYKLTKESGWNAQKLQKAIDLYNELSRRREEKQERYEEIIHNTYRQLMLRLIRMDRKTLRMRKLPYYP